MSYPQANAARSYYPIPSFVTGDGSQIGWQAPLNPATPGPPFGIIIDPGLNPSTAPPVRFGVAVPCRWGKSRGWTSGYVINPPPPPP